VLFSKQQAAVCVVCVCVFDSVHVYNTQIETHTARRGDLVEKRRRARRGICRSFRGRDVRGGDSGRIFGRAAYSGD
jgi:hypothetical protein